MMSMLSFFKPNPEKLIARMAATQYSPFTQQLLNDRVPIKKGKPYDFPDMTASYCHPLSSNEHPSLKIMTPITKNPEYSVLCTIEHEAVHHDQYKKTPFFFNHLLFKIDSYYIMERLIELEAHGRTHHKIITDVVNDAVPLKAAFFTVGSITEKMSRLYLSAYTQEDVKDSVPVLARLKKDRVVKDAADVLPEFYKKASQDILLLDDIASEHEQHFDRLSDYGRGGAERSMQIVKDDYGVDRAFLCDVLPEDAAELFNRNGDDVFKHYSTSDHQHFWQGITAITPDMADRHAWAVTYFDKIYNPKKYRWPL